MPIWSVLSLRCCPCVNKHQNYFRSMKCEIKIKIFHARHGVLTYLHVHEGLGHLHELIGAATQAGHGAAGVAR